ncbi:hypothetical protein QBC47DRAFT_118120 [Echria macrotheca]|uniref:Uncharacterized protein n=1 Tax=Echria macrotheca TaxID=438768 RepID=A0AAJ0FFL4_9PEZI|nr:hypothetical protein QBC47DRAFT_118120 [Echria macrotheca]
MGRLSTAKYLQLPQETPSTTDFPQGVGANTDCDIGSRHRLHAASLLGRWMMPLLFIGCALLSSGLTIVVMRDGATDCHPVQMYEKSQLMKSPVPEFPKEIRTFEFDEIFMAASTPQSDKAWEDLLPVGGGYIYVNDSADYGLQPGIQRKTGEIYSVAMYHQLHCLTMLRGYYWDLVSGVLSNDVAIMGVVHDQIGTPHTGHCFDYLRQSLECSADMTLEWPRTEADGRRWQVDGNHIPHVCTSRTAVERYMKDHHYEFSYAKKHHGH